MAGLTLKLLAMLALATFALADSDPNEVFVTEPEKEPYYTVEGQEGPVLSCGFKTEYRNPDLYEPQWTRYSHGKIWHISRKDKVLDKSHYALVQNPATGEYNLKIKQVDVVTDGSYHCSLLDLENGAQFASDPANVILLIAPGEPLFVSEPTTPVVEGEGISLKCRSIGGSPAPTISWMFDNKTVAESELYNLIEKDGAVESTIHWRARPEDNGAFLTCAVTNKALEGLHSKLAQSARLNVEYKPTVVAGPVQDYTVEEGQLVELTCNADGNPAPTSFEWKHIPSGERYISDRYSFTAEKSWAGDFECYARNKIGEGSDKVTLNVQYKPTVTTKESVNPSEGETITLDCMVDANPTEDIVQWSGPNGFTAKGNKLTIPSITRDQTGNYTCSATNYLVVYGQSGTSPRTGHSTVVVDVKRRPGQARITPPSLSVPVGGDIQLSCAAIDLGSPSAQYKWASPSSGGDFGTSEHNRELLYIRNAQLSDNGEYKCIAYNSIGEGETATVTVTVVEPATISRPMATERIYTSGEKASGMECEAQGYPTPSVNWFRDGQPVNLKRYSVEVSSGRPHCAPPSYCTQTVTSSLIFTAPIEWSDKGNYSCQAANGAAEPAGTWSLVRVIHSPQILNEKYGGESLAATDLGTTARISCRVSARPEPSFVWLTNSDEIDDGDRFTITKNKISDRPDEYESVLSFTDAKPADFGQYMCRSMNGKGEKAEVVIRLKEKSAPQAASGLQLLSATPTSLFIGWKSGFDGGYSQTFLLEYRKLNPFTETIANEEVTTVEVKNLQRIEVLNNDALRGKRSVPTLATLVAHNLTNLSPLSTYYFRIRSKNEMGMSEFTPIEIATTEDVYEDKSINAPVALKYDIPGMGLTVEPVATADVCVEVYVSNGASWRGGGCWAPDRTIKGLVGGIQFRTRFCSRARALQCSPMSPIAVAPSPLSSRWGLVLPLMVAVVCALLLAAVLLICCRSRRSDLENDKKKKKKKGAERLEVSGPMPPPETKNTIVHGSATDSGVFTLENGNKGTEQYNTQTFSANETVQERDSWAPAPSSDPFLNDPYLNEYEGQTWHDYNDGSGSAENATATTHDDAETDSDGSYSGGGRRVMTEIIV